MLTNGNLLNGLKFDCRCDIPCLVSFKVVLDPPQKKVTAVCRYRCAAQCSVSNLLTVAPL